MMLGTISKVERKNGHKWRVRIDLPRGEDGERRRTSKIFDTKTEAERWQAKINHEMNEGAAIVPSESSLRDFLDHWLKEYAETNLKESTFKRYRQLIETHINPHLGDVPLNEVTPMALQKFYTHKLKDGRLDGKEGGLSSSTVRQMHAILHKAFESAKKWRMMQSNPADRVDAPKQKQKEIKTLSASQINRLLTQAESQSPYSPVYHVAGYMGLRRGELLGLRWEDVDLEEGQITINQTLIQTTDGAITFDQPKTNESRRTLRLPQQVQLILKRHKKEQAKRRMRLGPDWKGERDLVFTATNGAPIRPRNLQRDFKQLLEEADLPEVRFHDLRHSCATLLLEEEVHPKVVQSILGHRSIQTTLDTYSHVSGDLQEKASEKLAESLDDKSNRIAN